MIFRIPISQGVVWVSATNPRNARRQAKQLSRDMGYSARLQTQLTVHEGHYALGSEALLWLKKKDPTDLRKKGRR